MRLNNEGRRLFMMKTREEIKLAAKGRLAENRGNCIGVYLLTVIVGSAVGAITAGVGALLLMPVVIIAGNGFFTAVYHGENRTVSDWFGSMFDNYPRKLGGYLWSGLWTALWSMLFFIPGVVKALAYSMAPYILADCPEVGAKDALRLSIRMTNGYKMDLFVAALSFLGWELLSAFTCGILEILFVGPYREITFGGIYEELKRNALENGVIDQAELEGGTVRYQ